MNSGINFSFTVNMNLGEIIYPGDSTATIIAKQAINKGAMQKLFELRGLIEFLEKKQIKTVVEIGTAQGGTLYALCQIAPADAKIISIDLPGGKFGGGYTKESIPTFKTYAKSKQELVFMREDSHSESTKNQLIAKLNGSKVDILFIDGDHTYEGVKKDFEMYSPLVAKDGIIVLHDICFHPHVPECQVDKFWNKIKKQFEYKEIIDPKDVTWGGIGIITKKD